MEFENIWQRYQPQLSNFVKMNVHEASIANDVLQEIGIKLHLALDQKKVINNHQAWLFQVARNTLADAYRKEQVFPQAKNVELTSNLRAVSKNTCTCDLVIFIIQRYLPKEYRMPLFLGDIEKLPQKEVAHLLGLSLTATKSRIQRARKKLREVVTRFFEVEQNSKGEIVDLRLKERQKLPESLLKHLRKTI
ncbi:sigma-70 family RNA polymerase sigma factor [Microscilla marina]|uniref:Sigma-70 region 2 n=1 Tax=Microscilla marina ATCC 23134 TaxID=313606 RepID=A1ZWJ5_MICM2|nr:sigma-70 family RNA polymerase sigma factor [Microscilla marina]EAY25235.1 sigma-70 region 2 [Microscilla marina ATCC 23134]